MTKETNKSIIIIGVLFFIFGFVTWLNSVLIPYLKTASQLNNFESYLVAFASYISYLVMAIPSAWVLKKIGFKNGMSMGLVVMAIGALIFIPAAISRTYALFLFGLFVQGTGLALLQSAANPYITILGPIESAAKRMSIMGICNKIAGALAPIIFGAILLKNMDKLEASLNSMNAVEKAAELDALSARVITPYIIMAVILIGLSILIYYSALPEITTDEEDETLAAANKNKTNVLQFPNLLLGTLAMFLYVGVEVIAGDTVISYARDAHGISTDVAKYFTTYTLIAMIVGYLIGTVTIPKYISQQKALQLSGILGIILGLVAIFTEGYISVLSISLLGLANALVFPAIWPLALHGLGRFTKIGSSFLIMALAGGAILPLIYGYLADTFDPQAAYWIVIPSYLYIWFFAVKGHKIK
ncbi:sugar MFS transporter [Salegentibacter salegens]|uniref:Glucose/galactose transporter n=1 Tax=Salegentibacter salegens TaxID=143223 RepID=A0A1M7NLV5_9FLAO|nr:sugar MFS transporter [Salegentibacter salegens]PRX39160.1 glucose/galactose transporter [Salegentibacter salegens]SHN04910.1 glucose/galactose transporter [Salegentibacter salegens]